MSEVECFAADVSKRELVIAVYPGEVGVKRIANQAAAISAWLDTLPAASVIAMEATGTYHRRLANLAYERGLVVYVVNPGMSTTTLVAWVPVARPIRVMPRCWRATSLMSGRICIPMCPLARGASAW